MVEGTVPETLNIAYRKKMDLVGVPRRSAHPGEIRSQPVLGFHVTSVHSMAVRVAMLAPSDGLCAAELPNSSTRPL